MQNVANWIEYLEELKEKFGVKEYAIVVEFFLEMLQQCPKDRASEKWRRQMEQLESEGIEEADISLEQLLNFLRSCPQNISVKIPLHPTR